MNLDHLKLFQRIVELGSMAAAARETGLSTTTVSERLAGLEDHYGTTLLHRTTRSISLTEAGRTLLDGIEPLLEDTAALEARIRHGAETLSGLIRVSAPSDLGRVWVSDVINQFQTQHPEVQFELLLSDGYIDIVGEGIDVALRFGTIADSSLRIRKLTETTRLVCASPDYIARQGRPRDPSDLHDHACLLMRFGEMLDNQWTFGEGPHSKTIILKGHRISNDGHLVRSWCLDGLGIALKSNLDVSKDLKEGRLVALFETTSPTSRPLQFLFPPNRRQPARVRAFADAIAHVFNPSHAEQGSLALAPKPMRNER